MKKNLFVSIFLVTTIICLGLETIPGCENSTFKPLYDFYSNNRLSAEAAGQGYAGIASGGNLSFANLNPATLKTEGNLHIYYEFGGKNEFPIKMGCGKEINLQNYRSGVAYGASYRVNDNIDIGLLYSKSGSHKVDMGKVYNFMPSGLAFESFDAYEKASYSVFSIPVAYHLNKNVSVGLGLNTHIYHAATSRVCLDELTNEYDQYDGEIDFFIFRPKVGLLVNILPNIDFGATIIAPTSKRIKEKVTWREINYDRNQFPMEAGVGLSTKWQNYNLLIDYMFVNEAINEEFIDRNEIRCGLEKQMGKNISLRTGYLYQSDYRDLSYQQDGKDFWDKDVSYEQHFLTLGASLQWKQSNFDFALMHSGLTSDLDQTYLKVGASLNLSK